tara:strand:- start:8360 stop:9463 length:1104 start_codon:yes stop_codon:yes gene_type:complete
MEGMVKVDTFCWDEQKVLVTGHTGFKGSWLLLWLLSLGAVVCGYSDKYEKNSLFHLLLKEKSISKNNEKWRHYQEDILNQEKLKEVISLFQPTLVIHMAAQSIVRTSYKKPLETWNVNLYGTLNLLDALKINRNKCAVVIVTTDKVYQNRNSDKFFKEEDKLGGYDPYSASKAAVELAVSSWRDSFFNNKNDFADIKVATARAGNVIGGGDNAVDRIVPDVIRSILDKKPITIRNPYSKRPWQHVLESLNGYLILGQRLLNDETNKIDCFNFGPNEINTKTVKELVHNISNYWSTESIKISCNDEPYEAESLKLDISKSKKILNWQPHWDFDMTVEKTINWYKNFYLNEKNAYSLCLDDINDFMKYL